MDFVDFVVKSDVSEETLNMSDLHRKCAACPPSQPLMLPAGTFAFVLGRLIDEHGRRKLAEEHAHGWQSARIEGALRVRDEERERRMAMRDQRNSLANENAQLVSQVNALHTKAAEHVEEIRALKSTVEALEQMYTAALSLLMEKTIQAHGGK